MAALADIQATEVSFPNSIAEYQRSKVQSPAVAKDSGPSEMLRYLDDKLEDILPDTEYQKLTSHDAEIAQTTSRGDFHRCFRCAEWALELSGKPEHSHVRHLLRDIEAVVHELHDTGWAVEFGIMTPGRTVTDVELSWVDDALQAAKAVADQSGWDSVPWEQLLEELIAIEPSGS